MMKSWIPVPPDSDFSIGNLPFGVFSTADDAHQFKRCATRLGNTVIDLSVLQEADLFHDIPDLDHNIFCQSTLNPFIEHPAPVWSRVRQRLQDLFRGDKPPNEALYQNPRLQKASFYSLSSVQLHLPIRVGDYTDFYSSREHATNVGTMFRGANHALQPNWLHLPVGYHGRASTVVPSGYPVHRPVGQLQKDESQSIHAPCQRLDFELEVAAVVGGPANEQPLTIQEARERIFGFVLMNDWSARDIQKWEYVPLGPFTSKNFCTTISPWIVTTAALEPFSCSTSAGKQENPQPLEYLRDPHYASYNVELTVAIQTDGQPQAHDVCHSNFRNLYWDPVQQLVHHSVTGCKMVAGDLLGSGTISGKEPGSFGSMLELSWNGTKQVSVGNDVRSFLEDGDTVLLSGHCEDEGLPRVGFGSCSGKVLPPRPGKGNLSPKTTKETRYRNIKLYGYFRSSCTWRVRVALAAKDLNFTLIPVDLLKQENRSEWYMEKNVLGQVPLLELIDTFTEQVIRISQSIAILDFLDEVFPNTRSLIPRDPIVRAAAMEMVEVVNAGTQPLQNRSFVRNIEAKSEGTINAMDLAREANENGLQALETLVQKHREKYSVLGPYCLGTFSPTVVDAVMVPQMRNARLFGADVNKICPLLVEIEDLCSRHVWFQTTHPEVQPDYVEE